MDDLRDRAGSAVAALSFRGVSKTFGRTVALNDVSLDISAGEVHGVIGHNGSGKSTLARILSGLYRADAGVIRVNGAALPPAPSLGVLRRLGIAIVHQDLGLVPSQSVLDNLRLGRYERSRLGNIRWRAERDKCAEAVGEFGLRVQLDAPLGSLDGASQRVVALARAMMDLSLVTHSGVLVLDEITATLPPRETEIVFDAVTRLRVRGVAVAFTSHNVHEVLRMTDRVTALRNGRVVATRRTQTLSHDELAELMSGRPAAGDTDRPRQPERTASPTSRQAAPCVLKLERLSGGRVASLDLEVRRGEIVGVTGLVESGLDDVPVLIAGSGVRRDGEGGRVLVAGRPLRKLSPRDIREAGVFLLPSDRQRTSGIPTATVRENMTLGGLKGFQRRWGVLDRRGERAAVDKQLRSLDVRLSSQDAPLAQLSGGNQQKVLIGRGLLARAPVLVLHEPTVGVDVGSRREIHTILRAAANEGTAVLVVSAEFEELTRFCDRVVVLYRGRTAGSLEGKSLTEADISRLAQGASAASSASIQASPA